MKELEYVNKDYLIEKGFGKEEARIVINKARKLMEKDKMYVPFTRPLLATK